MQAGQVSFVVLHSSFTCQHRLQAAQSRHAANHAMIARMIAMVFENLGSMHAMIRLAMGGVSWSLALLLHMPWQDSSLSWADCMHIMAYSAPPLAWCHLQYPSP